MNNVKDPDVRRALETLADEFENIEDMLYRKDSELDDRDEEVKKLKETIVELEVQVKELEEALAEAYLTEEANGREEKDNN